MATHEERLARELIAEVTSRLGNEAVALQTRIDEAMSYMDMVEQPNTITLYHIRRILTGQSSVTPVNPSKPEDTGPRLYVQNRHSKQGHVLDIRRFHDGGRAQMLVQWHAMGAEPVWAYMDSLEIILPSEVHRCPNGQTRLDCGSGDNRCELCLADEDNEADEIEESMGLR